MRADSTERERLVGRQLRVGWRALALFIVLGVVLEALIGLKIQWYVDVDNETRRLVWRLAHAHGTLLSLVTILFALSVRELSTATVRRVELVSRLLLAALVLLPGGFFLGGLVVYGGDPGLGIVLAPAGAATLLVGVWLIPGRPG